MASSRPMRSDAQRNRARLIEIAQTAFAEEGLAVSLDEIARRAGVGPGTLYRHFPTKESLFEAVVHGRMQQLIDDARERLDSNDPGAALLDFIDRLVTDAAPKRDLVEALASAKVDMGRATLELASDLEQLIKQLLSAAQLSGTIRTDIDGDDLMALISGLFYGLRPDARHRADLQRVLNVLHDGLRSES